MLLDVEEGVERSGAERRGGGDGGSGVECSGVRWCGVVTVVQVQVQRVLVLAHRQAQAGKLMELSFPPFALYSGISRQQ